MQSSSFNCFFIFSPRYVALCASKARHRFGSEKVSWCLDTSLFLRFPSRDGTPSLPLLSLFLFVFNIFSYLLSKSWVAFLGAGCPLPAFRSCFVEFTRRLNALLMNLWGRKCSPRPTPPPSWLLPPRSYSYAYNRVLTVGSRDCLNLSTYIAHHLKTSLVSPYEGVSFYSTKVGCRRLEKGFQV